MGRERILNLLKLRGLDNDMIDAGMRFIDKNAEAYKKSVSNNEVRKALLTLELGHLQGVVDNDTIRKARMTKYYKREGSPGNYKYYYTKEEYDKSKGVKKEEVTDYGKALSSSSRFKPSETVTFEQPIVGPNGNKLISYQWSFQWSFKENHEGELVNKRISDWTQAESSAETGRDIVHKFAIKRKDGVEVTVSSETVPILLGYADKSQMANFTSMKSAVKTLAKQRMQLAILKAQKKEYDDIKKEIESSNKPEIKRANINDLSTTIRKFMELRKKDFNDANYFKMGNIVIAQHRPGDLNENTKEELNIEWVNSELKKIGIKAPYGLYDLERRVERQEKKVENLFNSKIKTTED